MSGDKEHKSSLYKNLTLWGCGAPLLLLMVISFSAFFYYIFSDQQPIELKPPKFITEARKSIKTKTVKLKKLQQATKKNIDLDQTVMSLFSIQKALEDAKDFKSLTEYIMQNEADRIDPKVLELKYRFFNIYKNLLDVEDESEELKSMYNLTTGTLLDVLSSVSVATASYDREQVKKVWHKRLAESKLKRDIQKRLKHYQNELLDFYFDYMAINSTYMRKWDKLCSYRDRAYLAVYEKDWNEAVKNASEAVHIAPNEKEAHILLVMALMESKLKENNIPMAEGIIKEYLEKHKGQQAPALLLKGVIEAGKGNYDTAILDFDQSAAYFPKQKDLLLDRLNLYKKRQFLNDSKEGRMIINLYRGIMSGAGYFSPDFQKARVLLKKGDKEKAKRKIFDHFFRRRFQGQWDRVFTDFKFCNYFLKTDLQEIFANGDDKGQIKLEIDSAFFTNSIIVSINNESNFDLHNMTVLLCVRFTDMFKGDYVCLPVGETVATLKAGEKVTVGRRNITDITKERLGKTKEFKDIIDYASVLISDELITWVEPETAVIQPVNKEPVKKAEEKDESLSGKDVKKALKDLTDSAVEAFYKMKDGEKAADNTENKETTKKIMKSIVDKAVDSSEDKSGKSK